jgi:ribosomal protein L7/L12
VQLTQEDISKEEGEKLKEAIEAAGGTVSLE